MRKIILIILLTYLSIYPFSNMLKAQELKDKIVNRYLEYLSVPDPECGFNWQTKQSDFDPLLHGDLSAKLQNYEKKIDQIRFLGSEKEADIFLDASRILEQLGYEIKANIYKKEAIDIYKKLFEKQPNNPQLAYKIGKTLLSSNESSEANVYFLKAIELNNDYYPAYIAISENLFNDEWTTQTTKCLINILSKPKQNDINYADLYYSYYWYFFSRWVFDVADVLFDAVGTLSKSDLVNSAAANAQMEEKYKELFKGFQDKNNLALLNEAFKEDSNNVQYRGSLAAAQIGKVYIDAVFEVLPKLDTTKVNFESVDEIFKYLFELQRQKHSELLRSAKYNLDWVIKNWRNDFPAAHFNYGILETIMGNDSIALRNLIKAIELNPEESDYYETLCGFLMITKGNINNLDTLKTIFDEKCKNCPTGEDCYRVGAFYFWGEDYSKSEEAFRNALSIDPDNLSAAIALPAALLAQGDMKKAKIYLKSLYGSNDLFKKLDEKQKGYLYLYLGILALCEGDEISAAAWLKKAIGSNEKFTNVNELLQELESKMQK